MSLYVLDSAGEMTHMERMDGQRANDIRTALLKAQTALRLREPTSIRGTQLKNDPRELPRNTDIFKFFLVSGGIPITVDGQMIGAVGVSGIEGGEEGKADEDCAIVGLKAAFGEHVLLPLYRAAGEGGAAIKPRPHRIPRTPQYNQALSEHRRIVLVTTGSLGDIHPFLAVGEGLQRRGHAVAFATWLHMRALVESCGLEFCPLSPDVDALRSSPDFRNTVMDFRFGTLAAIERVVFPYLQQNYEELSQAFDGADLVVTHNWSYAAPIVAEKYKKKWLSVYLQPLGFFSHFDPPFIPSMPLQTRIGPAARWTQFLTMPLAKVRLREFIEPVEQLRERVGLPRCRRHPMFESSSPFGNMGWFSRVLGTWRPDWPVRTAVTGFVEYERAEENPPIDEALNRFLQAGPEPVIFTAGSSAVLDAADFWQESAAAAVELGVRAVLVVGSEQNAVSRLGAPNIHVAGYVPYSQIFSRGSVIVHAGGIGTIAHALRAARPMVIVPFAHDQPDNAHRAARLGVARMIPRSAYKSGRVAAVLGEVLRDRKLASKAAKLARQVQAEDGVAKACDYIEKFL